MIWRSRPLRYAGLALAIHVALAGAYALVSPPLSGPDEFVHFEHARWIARRHLPGQPHGQHTVLDPRRTATLFIEGGAVPGRSVAIGRRQLAGSSNPSLPVLQTTPSQPTVAVWVNAPRPVQHDSPSAIDASEREAVCAGASLVGRGV